MSEEQQQPTANNSTPATISQAEMVELLQRTIGQLDRLVERLNSEAIAPLPLKTDVETLVASTEALTSSLVKSEPIAPVVESPPAIAPEIETVQKTETQASEEIEEFEEIDEIEAIPESGIDKILPSFYSLETWWDSVLDKIRSFLPASLENKLSDWTITGILAGIVVTVLLSSVWFLQQEPSTEIVEAPSETPPQASPEPTTIVETPPELKAPGKPEPVEIVQPPEPELTPEQSLIAAIQEQVASISSQFPEGLVLSVEANFLGSRLIVTVGDDWYKLSPNRQDKLANTILGRSQKLDFRKLEIVSSNGDLLARNPVVGNKAIVIQREV
jgi:hypothetical protein